MQDLFSPFVQDLHEESHFEHFWVVSSLKVPSWQEFTHLSPSKKKVGSHEKQGPGLPSHVAHPALQGIHSFETK